MRLHRPIPGQRSDAAARSGDWHTDNMQDATCTRAVSRVTSRHAMSTRHARPPTTRLSATGDCRDATDTTSGVSRDGRAHVHKHPFVFPQLFKHVLPSFRIVQHHWRPGMRSDLRAGVLARTLFVLSKQEWGEKWHALPTVRVLFDTERHVGAVPSHRVLAVTGVQPRERTRKRLVRGTRRRRR